ncbi:hypothetical protein [Streptomyces coelicoflavus]
MHTPALDAAAVATMRTITTTAEDLRAIREQWGDLLHAIGQRPRGVWPPLDSRALGVAEDPEPTIGRLPLTLREHPAPVNLDALDAAMSTERALFELADRIAEQAQRPVRRHRVALRSWPPSTELRDDQADRDDPARWHLPTHNASVTARAASPGSRAYGLHWAAVWIEGRILGEQSGDLFRPVPLPTLDEAAATIRRARHHIDDALRRAGETTPLDDPCPWCRGQLTARTRAGDPEAAVIVCATGEGCGAPVILDHGRRVWQRETLAGLYTAMEAARARGAA